MSFHLNLFTYLLTCNSSYYFFPYLIPVYHIYIINMQPNAHCSNKIYHRLRVYLPTVLIICLILLIYLSYVFTYITFLIFPGNNMQVYPFLHTTTPEHGKIKGIFFMCVVSLFFILLTIALIRVIFMDPGYLPNPMELEFKIVMKNTKFRPTSQSKKLSSYISTFDKIVAQKPLTFSEGVVFHEKISRYILNQDDLREQKNSSADIALPVNTKDKDPFDDFANLDFSKATLCGTCIRWKFERSHHCKQCGKCVLKMDHHCPWLANCIGFRNYKYFLLMQMYGVLGTLVICGSFLEAVINYNLNYDSHLGYVILILFSWTCNVGLCGFLTWLMCINWVLMFKGETVVENSDKERFPSTKTENIYNLGCWKNFTSVFGKNPFIWFIPFYANYEGRGLKYENNKGR